MHRRLRQRDVARQLRLVDELAEAQASCPHETAEIGQRRDRGEVLEVALQVRAHVAFEPDRPLLGRPQVKGRGRKAATASQRAPVLRGVGLRR
jgi:hypothetical protein